MLVEIVDSDPAWPRAFEALRAEVAATPGVVAIEHVGSTSVPGLAAKPVIDVMIGVRDASILEVSRDEPFDPAVAKSLSYDGPPAHIALVSALVASGFDSRSHGAIPNRLFLRRDIAGRRAHHLHVAEIDGAFWREHLLFRDYLRAHPARAAAYGAHKRELALRFPNSVEYVEAKGPCIAETLALARAWLAATAAPPAR